MLKTLLQVQLASVLSAASLFGRGTALSLALSEALAEQALDATRRARASGSDDVWSRLPDTVDGPYRDYVRGLSAISGLSDMMWLDQMDRLRARHAAGPPRPKRDPDGDDVLRGSEI
jgi:hypothetical protein